MSTPNETERAYKVQTLGEWCAANNEPYALLEAGGELVRRYPGAQAGEFFDIKTPPVFVGRLRDTVVLPVSTFNCTPDHALIYAGLTHRDYALASDLGPFLVQILSQSLCQLRIPNEMPVVEQECIFLGGRANFGHFIFESLARWALGARIPGSGSLPVAIYDGMPERFHEFLELAGIPRARHLRIDMNLPTRFKRVWRVSSPLYMGTTPTGAHAPLWWPKGVGFIHSQVRSGAGLPDGPSSLSERPILYVARGPQKWRRILNEAEVIECVKKYGGTPITLDGLSAQEQVRLVGNARAMILHSGAANAISLFAPQDCAIVEFQPTSVSAFFGPVAYASCLGQPYRRIHCRVATAEEALAAGFPMNSEYGFDADYWVDCQALGAALKSLLP